MGAPKKVQIEGHIREVVASGEAVLETEQGLVFARGGLPGETLRVSLDPKRGRVRRARLVQVAEASPARVVPACAYAERCGGCTLMHASLELQRALRLRFLRDALTKAGVSEQLPVRATTSTRTLGYRRRARLAYGAVRGRESLGFRRERSHELVDVQRCVVLVPALQAALERLRARLLGQLRGEGEIGLALGREGGAAVVIHSAGPQPPAVYEACQLLAAESGIAGLALYAAGASKPALYGDAREWSEGADGAPLEGAIGGFSQAHAEINQLLVARVAELAQTRDARVLELYAGAGNLTVALAPGAHSYSAVERSPDAVRALRQNLAARGLSAKVLEGDAERALAGGPLDVVVLDPPRTGAPGVLPALLARKPKRIVYVSCDPATLGRDLAELLSRGYALTWAEAFEMFPHTAELESVVRVERTGT